MLYVYIFREPYLGVLVVWNLQHQGPVLLKQNRQIYSISSWNPLSLLFVYPIVVTEMLQRPGPSFTKGRKSKRIRKRRLSLKTIKYEVPILFGKSFCYNQIYMLNWQSTVNFINMEIFTYLLEFYIHTDVERNSFHHSSLSSICLDMQHNLRCCKNHSVHCLPMCWSPQHYRPTKRTLLHNQNNMKR